MTTPASPGLPPAGRSRRIYLREVSGVPLPWPMTPRELLLLVPLCYGPAVAATWALMTVLTDYRWTALVVGFAVLAVTVRKVAPRLRPDRAELEARDQAIADRQALRNIRDGRNLL